MGCRCGGTCCGFGARQHAAAGGEDGGGGVGEGGGGVLLPGCEGGGEACLCDFAHLCGWVGGMGGCVVGGLRKGV